MWPECVDPRGILKGERVKEDTIRTAFIRKPDFALDPHRGRSLLGHTHLRRHRDRVIVPHRRHRPSLLRRVDIRDRIRAGVARGTARFLRELRQGARGEGGEDIRHRVPRAPYERAMDLVGAAGADCGQGLLLRHGDVRGRESRRCR